MSEEQGHEYDRDTGYEGGGEDSFREAPVNDRGRAFDPDATSDECSFAMYMHMMLLAHLVLPWIVIVAPIIMWQTKKNESPFLDDHGREAVNFQITLSIYTLCLVPVVICTFGIGAVLIIGIYALAIVGMIQASQAANRGEFYRYPMTMRFLH